MAGEETLHINTFHNSPASSYEDYFCFLFDCLRLLNLRLLKLFRSKQTISGKDADTGGIFISGEEVSTMLNSLLEADTADSNTPETESIDIRIKELNDDIGRKLSNTGKNPGFPLPRLARIFGLTPSEADVLIIALAPEMDRRYERIYAYFNDDITKKAPSVGLATDILFNEGKDGLTGMHIFSTDALLLRYDLIRFTDNRENGLFLNREFTLDERIKRFIMGDNGFQKGLSEFARILYPDHAGLPTVTRQDIKDKITYLLRNNVDTGKTVFWFYGLEREQKKTTAGTICNEVKVPMLVADLEDIFFESDYRTAVKSLYREAALQSAFVFITAGDILYGEDERSRSLKKALLRIIGEMSWFTFISADVAWMPDDASGQYQWYPFEFKPPLFSERKRIWAAALNGSNLSEPEIDTIAARFNFTESRIKDVVFYAKRLSGKDGLTLDGICDACTIRSNKKLGIYATKVTPRYNWNDIVLPEDRMRQLREICANLRHKHIVYFKWGFEKKLALGKGLNVLFSGPSGTGKTMAADIIANDLKLEMYKIDLSSVVSKYIGETEKNLNRIFREASSGNIILFFDEADALFGKRSEVKDAHDRYANIETNYLLQKVEEHEGIVILATNLSKNIDEAFLRRLHFTVEFPFPDEGLRASIWKKIFPDTAPVSKDMDYAYLAEKLKLAGGNIKNIALTSAFYAAEEASGIRMDHIIRATKREYRKMGKVFVKDDLTPYGDLVQEGEP